MVELGEAEVEKREWQNWMGAKRRREGDEREEVKCGGER